MKRVARISGLNDYIAIDLVQEENGREVIKETIWSFYKNKLETALYKDREEGRWTKVNVLFDGEKLICADIDDKSYWKGMEWETDIDEFLDSRQIKPLL